nr:S8 family serine peptidase [Thioalkalivibrio sp. ALE16]
MTQTTVQGGETVKVAVIDNGFRPSHEEFEGRIAGTYDVVTDSTDPEDVASEEDVFDHGTPVSALIAGNTFGIAGNAELEMISAGSSLLSTRIRDGVEHASSVNARVINLSLGPAWRILDRADSVSAIQSVEGPDEATVGAVVVASAGNRNRNLSDPEDGDDSFDFIDYENLTETQKIWENLIIAGAASGYQKASYSNYAGEMEEIQDRFMVAQGTHETALGDDDDATGFVSGTSYSAPLISASAATIISKWPHLTAAEVTNRLLETADQGSELYEQNDCGPEENLNCGYYYLGQGHLDLEAAMEPDGEVAIAAGEAVEGETHSIAGTHAAWSSSFGGGFDTNALAGVVGFDELGRDYELDLSSHSYSVLPYGQRLGDRVNQMATAGLNPRPVQNEIAPGLSLTSHHVAGGAVGASEMRLDTGVVELSAFGFHQGETGIMDPWAPESGMAMLSDGSGGLSHLLDRGAGFGVTLPMSDRMALDVGHYAGSANRGDDNLYAGYRQARTDVAMRFAATDALELEAGYGQRHEDGGLLGSRGNGALSLGDSSTTGIVSVGANYSMGDHFGLMARYERGHADVAGGPGMIRSIEGLTTEQSALGVTFERDQHEAIFMVSQPLRVTGGTANLNVPVGRDLDGNVIREERSASLAAAGRQQDVELGYAYAPSQDSRLNVNLLYSNNPDHQDGSDVAGVATFSKRF